jgi:4-diphosphocytidyl-2-C-methyl-D-erythritol kinase
MSLAQEFDPTVTVRASAKINLYLGVGRPRPDGFHPLATVYQAVSLHDDVTVRASADWSVDVVMPDLDPVGALPVPTGPDNIAIRAGTALVAHHGLGTAAAIAIHKSIPVAAGMAGGSADAAATLVGLDRLWDLQTPDDELLALAAALGSDVPFALLGGTAEGTGRGEQVQPLHEPHTRWWVVVPSAQGLSTPAVYRHYDELRPDAPEQVAVPAPVLTALSDPDPRALARRLHNDLEDAALDLRPELAHVLRRGAEAGALRGMVSGSGPTCVFLCADRPAADEVRADFVAGGYDGVRTALGPVAGVHLVEQGPGPGGGLESVD